MAGEPPLLRVKNAVIEPLPLAVRSWLVRIVALVAFVAVWWLVSGLRLIDETFLPTPKAVWDATVRASTWHQVAPGVPREVLGEQNYFL
ncbi:ABC transporter permease, partial [Mycobacterium kansasii]